MSSKTWFRPQKSDSTIFVASDLMDKLSDKITKAVQDLARSGLFEMVSHEGMDKHNPKKKMAGPRRGMQHYKLATWEAIQAKQEAKALCDELQLNRDAFIGLILIARYAHYLMRRLCQARVLASQSSFRSNSCDSTIHSLHSATSSNKALVSQRNDALSGKNTLGVRHAQLLCSGFYREHCFRV